MEEALSVERAEADASEMNAAGTEAVKKDCAGPLIIEPQERSMGGKQPEWSVYRLYDKNCKGYDFTEMMGLERAFRTCSWYQRCGAGVYVCFLVCWYRDRGNSEMLLLCIGDTCRERLASSTSMGAGAIAWMLEP